MTLIGLTGGIASGKSTVAARLAELGAVVVDADQLAREAVARGSHGLAQVVAAFGPRVLTADGDLDRALLGQIVFGDEPARARLNAIVHPEVFLLSRARFAAAFAADPNAVVVYDVPLLVEAGPGHAWDMVVVAHAPVSIRRQRLVELRGLSGEEADRRIAAQATDAERLAIADVVIDTGGSLDETIAQVDALWARLTGVEAV